MTQTDPRIYQVGEIFTPSTPIDKMDLFAGRVKEVERVVNAIIMAGQHIALYGERGVGKTSLASVIHDFLPKVEGMINVKINCDADTTFKSLFKNILEEIKLVTKAPGMGFKAQDNVRIESLDHYIAEEDINPNSLRFLFRQLQNKIIIIIDEFDRVEDEDTKRLLADTIKNFSDYKVDVTFMIVGIADSVDDLIAEHHSIERALVQVNMPRMKTIELNEVINKGLKKLGMTINTSARQQIVTLSQGLPHYTHSLAFYAAKSALQARRNEITRSDVTQAISNSVEMGQQTIEDRYFRAINSPRGNIYPQVLLACAMAPRDETGYFTATGVKAALSRILKKDYEIAAFAQHLKQFCSPERGPVLKQVGFPRRYKYRFVNPLLEPYTIMKGLAKGMINSTDLVS
jgi:Cdc6-like AAA superfamily ATPase